MASQSIAGINVKIGADLSDLREEVGKVGDTIEDSIPTGKDSPVQDLADDFKDVDNYAETAQVSIGQIAEAVAKIGGALLDFAKDSLKEALEVNPETAATVDELSSAFDGLKTAFGEALIPLINEWAPKLTKFLNDVAQWAKDNPETAETIVLIAGAFGGLAVAAGAALPIIAAFNLSMITLSASTLGVAGVIVGLIGILAWLSTSLDEIGIKASGTADEIANMDTNVQQIVENGIGELEVVDIPVEFVPVWDEEAGDYVEQFARWNENLIDPTTGARGYWEPVKESMEEVTVSAEEVGGAMETTAAGFDSTAESAGSAQEILDQMKLSMEGIGEVTQEVDLGDTMSTLNEVLGSEAFQTFTKEPIAEEVGESWNAFAESITGVADGFGVMEESLGEESPISAGLQQLQGTMSSVITTSNDLCTMFTTTLPTAIKELLKYVCQVSVDEEGNLKANGGNTLYTSWGTIFGLFSDIFTVCQNLAQFWKKDIPEAVKIMIDTSGKAESTLQSLSTTAQGCAGQFNALANAILAVIDAYQQFASLKIGAGGGGRGHSDLFKADGGPVKYGSAYIVGENGPEIFTPDRSGYIIPNDEISGYGRNVTINVAFEGDVIGDADSITGYVKRACEEAIREEVYAAA